MTKETNSITDKQFMEVKGKVFELKADKYGIEVLYTDIRIPWNKSYSLDTHLEIIYNIISKDNYKKD